VGPALEPVKNDVLDFDDVLESELLSEESEKLAELCENEQASDAAASAIVAASAQERARIGMRPSVSGQTDSTGLLSAGRAARPRTPAPTV
jgi:hypothetical protein